MHAIPIINKATIPKVHNKREEIAGKKALSMSVLKCEP
ncbi:hypothetical protein ES705_18722 [subsurface metagenome]